MKFFIAFLGLLLAAGIYLGIPYEVWHWMAPATFWQKAALGSIIGVYEWLTFWIGFVVVGGIIATIAD